mgnify:FL=1
MHILWANQINCLNEDQDFYKLDEESVTTIREDLANNYLVIVKCHSTEIAQLVEDFGDAQIQASLELEAYEAEQKRVEKEQAAPEAPETIMLPNNDSSEHSLVGNENVAPIPPHETEKPEQQILGDPPTMTSELSGLVLKQREN